LTLDAPTASPDLAARLRRERGVAIAMMAFTLVCFTALDSCAKFLSRDLPAMQIVWARYMGAAVVAAGVTRVFARPRLLRSRRPGLQIFRSLLLFGSTIGNFLALRSLQLAETSTIAFLAPIFIALLAGPLLGEWPGRARWVAIFVGFAGVLMATRPGAGAFHPVVLVAVGGALCGAGYSLATRGLAGRDSGQTTLLWTQFAGAAILTPLLPWIWIAPPNVRDWALLGALGALGAVGHSFLIMAHRRAPASTLAPFNYTQLIWMIASGYLVFGDWPPPGTLAGAGLVGGCGLFLLWRERREGKKR
jgi:drug/metabolite transporter (DMT)-like permease